MGSDSEVSSDSHDTDRAAHADTEPETDRSTNADAASRSRGIRSRAATGDRDRSAPAADPTRVLLLMCPGRDRDLVADALDGRYRVDTATAADTEALDRAFDCCVLDEAAFDRVADAISTKRAAAGSVFVPFALVVSERSGTAPADAWNRVDDVIELPVKRRMLVARIDNLIQRRTTSRRLAETVNDLRLKEQAMDESPIGITLALATEEGENPLVYCNEGFESLTGYGPEMLGKDCRFLQGDDTADETRARLRRAIDAERPIAVDILNYRANDQKFWNRLTVSPIRDETGTVTHYVGFQSDITDRKIRERRLEVMGRVLNHNLRNKMNLIEGYADLLRADIDDESHRRSLDVITETSADLMGIARAVQKIDETLADTDPTQVALHERLIELRNRIHSRYPEVAIEVSLPDDDPITVTVVGLFTAIEEGAVNAVKHNDTPSPWVAIRVERLSRGWIRVEIEDDGPGIPDHETQVLERGETSLTHADRLGIWLMYWVVTRAGGKFTVTTGETGTLLRLEVPAHP
ncbi:PAS domain-containing protein [Halorubrum sp. BV1]|uniref:PAS domain-containing protein n=1 Tax=Halorubrum sp. BV1 TaxID=1498500 RepID=UPI0009B5B58A|nr:PAS domain-containing protein [Halorubrum sp. BV1]